MRPIDSPGPDARLQRIENGFGRTHFGAQANPFTPMESLQPIDFASPLSAELPKTRNYRMNPRSPGAACPINICNAHPPLHFPNDSHTLNLSDVERISNPIPAPRRRPTPTPCNQHYYFGHRIRPRVRPPGRVSEATSGDRQSGWWPFLFCGTGILACVVFEGIIICRRI